jgi:hypothetical protein
MVKTHSPSGHLTGRSIEQLPTAHDDFLGSIHLPETHRRGFSSGHPLSLGHNSILSLQLPSGHKAYCPQIACLKILHCKRVVTHCPSD